MTAAATKKTGSKKSSTAKKTGSKKFSTVKKTGTRAKPTPPSNSTKSQAGRHETVTIGSLTSSGLNPRTDATRGIDELAADIRRNGLYQYPVVRPAAKNEQRFEVVAGERRFNAIRKLGWNQVPVIVREDLKGDDAASEAVALGENSPDTRYGLSEIEMGRQCLHLQDKHGLTVRKIASMGGLNEKSVRRYIEIAKAPEDIQKKVESGQIGYLTGIELAGVDDPNVRAEVEKQLEGMDTVSRADARRAIKAATQAANAGGQEGGEGETQQGGSGSSAGPTPPQSLPVQWRNKREVVGTLVRHATQLVSGGTEEEETAGYYANLGIVAALLYARGDIDTPIPPVDIYDGETEKAFEKRTKSFWKAVNAVGDPPESEEPTTDPNPS